MGHIESGEECGKLEGTLEGTVPHRLRSILSGSTLGPVLITLPIFHEKEETRGFI